jgi:hypothetical protein
MVKRFLKLLSTITFNIIYSKPGTVKSAIFIFIQPDAYAYFREIDDDKAREAQSRKE